MRKEGVRGVEQARERRGRNSAIPGASYSRMLTSLLAPAGMGLFMITLVVMLPQIPGDVGRVPRTRPLDSVNKWYLS